MKNILYLFIISTLVLASCKSQKNKKKVEEEVKTEVVKDEPKEVTEIMQEEQKESMLVVSMSRSVCFGECPAFNVKIYGNGLVMYEGIKNVKRMGKFKGKMQLAILTKFIYSADKMGFFKLKDKYDNENVTDLPTSKTFINFEGKKKEVTCRFECDKAIISINKMLEAILGQTAMKQYE